MLAAPVSLPVKNATIDSRGCWSAPRQHRRPPGKSNSRTPVFAARCTCTSGQTIAAPTAQSRLTSRTISTNLARGGCDGVNRCPSRNTPPETFHIETGLPCLDTRSVAQGTIEVRRVWPRPCADFRMSGGAFLDSWRADDNVVIDLFQRSARQA